MSSGTLTVKHYGSVTSNYK